VFDRRGLMVFSVALIALCPAARWALHEPGSEVAYMWTPCRLDALAWGALATLVREGKPGGVRAAAPYVGSVVMALTVAWLAVMGDPRDETWFAVAGYTAVCGSAAAMVLGLADGRLAPLAAILAWRPLSHLGSVSYGAYLVHSLWIVKIQPLGLPLWLGSAVVVLGTWASATLLYRTLERPILALKDVWAPYERARG